MDARSRALPLDPETLHGAERVIPRSGSHGKPADREP